MSTELVPDNETEVIDVLTVAEQARFDQDEAIIEGGLASFVEVGRALADIRDARLYRAEHGTFEKYVDARWGIGRRTAQQMIASGRTVDSLARAHNRAPSDPLPVSENATRPLAKYRARMRKVEGLNDFGRQTQKHGDETVEVEIPEDPDTDVIADNLADAWGLVVDTAKERGVRVTEALVTDVLIEAEILETPPRPGQSKHRNFNEQIGEVADRLVAAEKFLRKIKLTVEEVKYPTDPDRERDRQKALKFAAMADEIAAGLRRVAGEKVSDG